MQSMPGEFQLKNLNGQDLWVNDQDTESIEIREQSQVRIRISNIQVRGMELVRCFLACLTLQS
jgi:hypothetical protein